VSATRAGPEFDWDVEEVLALVLPLVLLLVEESPEFEPPHAESIMQSAALRALPRTTFIVTSSSEAICCDCSFFAMAIGGNVSLERYVSQNRDRIY
jgi:hypothetical protein